MSRASPEEFTEAIISEYKKYTSEVINEIKDDANKIGKSALRKVRQKSPSLTGHYKKGWRKKTVKNTSSAIGIRIYQNGSGYKLNHLLESGHKTRRHSKRTKAFRHIQSTQNEVSQEFSHKVDIILKKERN